MDKSNLSEEQQQFKDEALKRGTAFEELIRTAGWKYIQAYIQNKIQMFANNLLISTDKKMEDFEADRQEIAGLRKLLGFVESDIKALEGHRKEQSAVQEDIKE